MTYYNFNLSKHANYIKLASELLAQKGWPRYYAVGYYSEDFGNEVCDFNVPFTEEQYNQMKPIVEECKAKDIDLWDYFDGENYPEFLRLDEPGFHSDPRTINLDMAGYPCKIKMAIFYDGIDKAPQVIERVIVLSYDEYHELLVWQLMHRRSNYNDLHEDRPQLFKNVDEKIRIFFSNNDSDIMPFAVPLFAVELIDIKEEAFQLCGEADIERDIFNHSYEEIAERSFVGIDDRKMMFCYECFNYEKGRTSEILVLDDIDAIAVERALGVDSYAGIVDSLSVYFGERDGVARFAEFLRSKSIEFVEKDRY